MPFSHILLCLSHFSIPSSLSVRFLCTCNLSHLYYISGPSYPPSFDYPNNAWWRIRITRTKLLLCTFLQPALTSSLISPLTRLSLCVTFALEVSRVECWVLCDFEVSVFMVISGWMESRAEHECAGGVSTSRVCLLSSPGGIYNCIFMQWL
jgi:hypothetical protein